MNHESPDNLISAYFDGEATPEERAAVEKTLAESSSAHEQLQDFEEMRGLLQSLPRESAGDEFAASVLQAAERASLLNGELTTPPITAASTDSPKTRSVRSPLIVAGSLVATAAALFLATQFLMNAGPNPEQRGIANHKSDAAPTVAMKGGLREAKDAVARNSVARKTAVTEGNRVASGPLKMGAASGDGKTESRLNKLTARKGGEFKSKKAFGRNKIEKKNAAFRKQLVGPAGNSIAGGSRGNPGGQPDFVKQPRRQVQTPELAKQRFAGRTFRVGDVIPYFRRSGDETAVIEVTVVDVQQTVGSLQLLLSENRIPSSMPQGKNEKGAKRPTDKGGSGDLIAVYVETSSAQLTAALRELSRGKQPLQLKLKPPVETGNILVADARPANSAARSTFAKRGRRRNTLADAIVLNRDLRKDNFRENRPIAAKADTAKTRTKLASPSVAKSKSADKKRPRQSKPSATPNPGGKPADRLLAATYQDSFHFLLRVPSDTFRLIGHDRPEKKRRVASPKPDSQLDGKDKDVKLAASAPVRVIFIFREHKPVPARKPRQR